MHYYQYILTAAIVMQLFISCWARARTVSDSWPVVSTYLNDIEENSSNENSALDDNDLTERSNPLVLKTKKALRNGYYFGNEERRKKYLGESGNFHGGHNLQGLWAMPGRR
ncbi:unnamed protein product [Rotaria magnacalcarata]|uniref:Uncharacterized protein n=1 Tax=Rotaria magnacalcarata TaxID=392030 RepID=A0A816CW49_9BILA|nr:unnamed protein product [Rotaria magnacalcarata]CAF1954194.1 unnamed protein product [Rotaria magnacalcarata]CAF4266076.1 unnamed protein product [Rotaria magnacalcarata]CAF5026544.1 unnamed protein product [Rotaria magnacalcarata]CAF5168691.1 unnamed protein product [Rotaria magnacalcarata]